MRSRSTARRIGVRALAVLAASVPLLAAAQDDDNDLADRMRHQRCSASALKGSYGFVVHGVTDATSALPPALQGAFVSTGTTLYDGKGNVTITPRATSFNGFVQAVPAEKGHYSVSSDCVVSASYPSGVTTRNVLIDGGRAMYAIQTNRGTTIAGMSVRADAVRNDDDGRTVARCTAAGLAGHYGFLADGQAGPPTLPLPIAVPLVGDGVVTLERSGAFSLVAIRSVGGVIDAAPVTLPGHFTVGSDCAVQMKFDIGFNFAGTVVDGGREVLFVQTDPGTTLTVRARRQD